MPFCPGHFPGNYKKARWHSFTLFHTGLSSRIDLSGLPLLVSPLASSRTSQQTWQSTHFLSLLPTSKKDQLTWETTFTLLHWHSLTYFEQSAKHHGETTSSLWTIGVWEIIRNEAILQPPTCHILGGFRRNIRNYFLNETSIPSYLFTTPSHRQDVTQSQMIPLLFSDTSISYNYSR